MSAEMIMTNRTPRWARAAGATEHYTPVLGCSGGSTEVRAGGGWGVEWDLAVDFVDCYTAYGLSGMDWNGRCQRRINSNSFDRWSYCRGYSGSGSTKLGPAALAHCLTRRKMKSSNRF